MGAIGVRDEVGAGEASLFDEISAQWGETAGRRGELGSGEAPFSTGTDGC